MAVGSLVTGPTPPAPPDSTAALFEPAKIIARVGNEHILAGDILPHIDQIVEPYLEKVGPDQVNQQELEQQREQLMQQILKQAIETKLLYLDFLRQVPPERLPEIRQMLYKEFDKEELEPAMEQAEVRNSVELEEKLRAYGSSLEKQRRAYVERKLGHAALGQVLDQNPEVTHEEMLAYYRQHSEDYALPARVQWEQLTARFDRFPNRADAYRAIAEMGNEVLGGAPLEAVARRSSHGTTADEGGFFDWTTQGSLASKVLDHALFTIEPGLLSEILQDQRGFHIVRVIEREEASRVPFTEAQVKIKEQLRKENTMEQINAYVKRLRKETPVWTIFDDRQPEQGTASNRDQDRPGKRYGSLAPN